MPFIPPLAALPPGAVLPEPEVELGVAELGVVALGMVGRVMLGLGSAVDWVAAEVAGFVDGAVVPLLVRRHPANKVAVRIKISSRYAVFFIDYSSFSWKSTSIMAQKR